MDPGGQCVEGEGAGLGVGPGKLGNRLFGDDVEYEMDVMRLHDETYIGNPHTTGVSSLSTCRMWSLSTSPPASPFFTTKT